MRVRFLGSGDAVGSAGQFQACILIAHGDRKLLLDCGASSIVALKRAGIVPSEIGEIFVSHLHGDHFAGIPFVVLDGQFSHRTQPLRVVGPVGTEERVRACMSNLYADFPSARLSFPFEFVELRPGDHRVFDGLGVQAWSVPHDPTSAPLALRLELDGRAIGYSGDTAWTSALCEVAADTDLFICEAQTLTPKARIHVSYQEVLQHRAELHTKRLVLTHLGADVRAHAATLEIECATDELAIEL